MSLNELRHSIEALDSALLTLLETRIDGVSLGTAAEYGNRVNYARKMLRGEVDTESMTFVQKWEKEPERKSADRPEEHHADR